MATLAENRRARADFRLVETFEAGLVLRGFETKAVKRGKAALAGSRVIIRGGEAFLVGADIPPYQPGNTPADYDPQRTRKLLLAKKEIADLGGKSDMRGLTLIPLRLYTKSNLVKLEFALAAGLKKHDKRERIKEREAKRRIERTLKKTVSDD